MTRKKVTPPEIMIPPNQSVEGAQHSAKNARALFAAGTSAGDAGFYGTAIALYVLAAEEGSKAIVLWGHAVDPTATSESLPPIFYQHKVKHELAQFITLLANFMFVLISNRDRVQQDIDSGIIQKSNAGSEWVSRTTAELKAMANASEEEKRFITWYQSADELKKKGLYVNWKNGLWQTPADLGLAEYSECQLNVEWWLDLIDAYCAIPVDEARVKIEELKNAVSQKQKSST